MNVPWTVIESRMREEAYGKLDNDPQILLERDAWFDLDADLFHARLIGFEDEVVRELWLRKVEPVILVPIAQSMARMVREMTDQAFLDRAGIFDTDLGLAPMRTARYVLQSGFVTMRISGFVTDPPVEKLRDDHTAVVAYLRYRRRA